MIEIVRLEQTQNETLGVLLIGDEICCWTLENPWKQNAVGESCIPLGHYKAKRFESPNFGETFKILDLQDREPAERTGIVFHVGNTAKDTRGCILLGSEVGQYQGARAILESAKAVEKFMQKMSVINSCDCIIKQCC